MGSIRYQNIQSSEHLPIVARRPQKATSKSFTRPHSSDSAGSQPRAKRGMVNPKKTLKQVQKHGIAFDQMAIHGAQEIAPAPKQINQALIKKIIQKQTKHWPKVSAALRVGTAQQDVQFIQTQEHEFFRTPHLDSQAMYHAAFLEAEQHRSGSASQFPVVSEHAAKKAENLTPTHHQTPGQNPRQGEISQFLPYIESIVQQFIHPIDQLLHARSHHERLAKLANLNGLADTLKQQGHDPEVIDEVKAMLRHRHGEMIDQAIAMANSLAHIGTGKAAQAGANLMELWANPAGRQALAVMAATGIVIQDPEHLWFMGHWCQREWQGNPRILRRQLAETMFEHLRQRDRVTQRVFQRLLTKRDPKDKDAIAQEKTDRALAKLDPQRMPLYQQQQMILERQNLPLSDKIDPVYTTLSKRILALDKAIKKHEYDRDRQRKSQKTLTQILTDSPHEPKIKRLDRERQKDFKALKRDQSHPVTEDLRKRRRVRLKRLVTVEKNMHKLQKQALRDSRKLKWKQQLKFDRKTILKIESKLRKW